MPNLPVSIGESSVFTKTVGESDIYGFAGITGDFAAPHVNEAFMKKSQYGSCDNVFARTILKHGFNDPKKIFDLFNI